MAILIICILSACASDSKETTPAKESDKTSQTKENKNEADTPPTSKRIVFFGNSLSAGYGLDPEEGFVGLIEKRIDSLDLPYQVINAGVSGETTADGVTRINWILKQPIDIFILELGGNDALRGLAPKATFDNLQTIIDRTKTKYPNVKIIIAGMLAPPNMGSEFTEQFKNVFPRLAKENEALLIPFLLDKVGGIPELNLADGIHPNPEGHRIVTENIWSVLKTIL